MLKKNYGRLHNIVMEFFFLLHTLASKIELQNRRIMKTKTKLMQFYNLNVKNKWNGFYEF